jgi:mannitol-specific phosphotransferase system IIBC component
VGATSLPGGAVEAASAGVLFDKFPGVNDAFINGMHIGLWVAGTICAVVAALVLIAVREPKHHDFETVLEETVEGEAGHR